MSAEPQIRQRRVVYLMGFDPRGSGFYYQLLKREASRSKRRKMSALTFGPLQSGEQFSQCSWQQQDGPGGDYRFAEMLDLIQPHFRPTPGAGWWWWLHLCKLMLGNSSLWRPRGQSLLFSCFMLYPLLFPALILAFLAGTTVCLTTLVQLPWLGVLILPLLMLLADGLLRRFDHKLYLHYLLGDFLFTRAVLSACWPELEQRLSQWASQLADDVRALPPDGELLIVGHSSGGLLAARLAHQLQQQLAPEDASKWSLLTLGNQASTGLANGARPFHHSIAALTHTPGLRWQEVFAPQDIISSGRFDAGVLPGAQTGKIRLQSALLREALAPAEYRKMVLQFFTLHLQYLRASTTGNGFDYFQLLAQSTPAFDYQPRRATPDPAG
jgi:pimeloyl-ACP methyl ester carboxylesterase